MLQVDLLGIDYEVGNDQNVCKYISFSFLFFFNVYLFLRERERETEHEWRRGRERETQNQKQVPGSELSAQSLTGGSNS